LHEFFKEFVLEASKINAQPAVVVTGIGVICAVGNDRRAFENGLWAGRCGIGPVTLFDATAFPSQVAAQVQGDPAEGLPAAQTHRASRCDLLGLRAAREAVADARLHPDAPDARTGVILGGGAGGMGSWEKFRRAQFEKTPVARTIGPLRSSPPATLTDRIGTMFNFTGHRATITTACSSSATAVGYGMDLIRSGELDRVIVGGSEALSELTFGGFNALRVMAEDCCRPFDAERTGMCLGEGAAILVLESASAAAVRGARAYARVMGYAINADAYHMTAPDPDAHGMIAVMRRALEDAGVAPDQIDYVNAHGTATSVNDPAESLAICTVLGGPDDHPVAVSATKSMIGHCLGAAGGLEAAATVLAIYRQSAPPTVNLGRCDAACVLNHVAGLPRPMAIRFAMSNSFAFGGNNSCLVFGRTDAAAGEGI